ncbi:ABC transporter ATP-binding protein [Paenibacillus aurantiacus]|uniref:ABC transporter ATP-binding protein n=1 Tax=Paenibacillus aurantiacus TaxID=1936118 RepID=A0ABV5KM38_9BACL
MPLQTYRKRSKRYGWILSYLKSYYLGVACVVLCGVVIALGELALPKMIEYVVDDYYPNRDTASFRYLLLGFAGLIVVIAVAAVVRNMLQRVVGTKASRDLQFSVMKQIRRLGFAYYERHPVGETLSLMNEQVFAAQRLYNRFFPEMLESALFAVLAFVLMAQNSWILTAITIPCLLVYYFIGPYIDRNVSKWGREMYKTRIDFNKKVYETVSGLREFRAYSAEAWDLQENLRHYSGVKRSTLMWVIYIHARFSLRQVFFNIGTIVLFVVGYSFIRDGMLTVGGFVSFILLYAALMLKLSTLMSNLIEQTMVIQQMEPLHELMRLEPEVAEPKQAPGPLDVQGQLLFRQVRFGYPNRPDVLKEVNLEIRPGERTAIVGTSGGGKSTLLKLVCRFYDPLEGEVLLDGHPLPSLTFEQIRGSIGYVFQESYLFGISVRENIRFGKPDATDAEVEEAARIANAHEFILGLKDGYDTLVGDRGIKLSGGQRQRIAIARMVIKQPRIVLLDEATSALDNVSEAEVKMALDQVMKGRTVIAVAHRLSTIQDFDRILVLDEGRVAEVGRYDELLEKRGVFYLIAMGQMPEREEAV